MLIFRHTEVLIHSWKNTNFIKWCNIHNYRWSFNSRTWNNNNSFSRSSHVIQFIYLTLITHVSRLRKFSKPRLKYYFLHPKFEKNQEHLLKILKQTRGWPVNLINNFTFWCHVYLFDSIVSKADFPKEIIQPHMLKCQKWKNY